MLTKQELLFERLCFQVNAPINPVKSCFNWERAALIMQWSPRRLLVGIQMDLFKERKTDFQFLTPIRVEKIMNDNEWF